jgi:hypothetical protein
MLSCSRRHVQAHAIGLMRRDCRHFWRGLGSRLFCQNRSSDRSQRHQQLTRPKLEAQSSVSRGQR